MQQVIEAVEYSPAMFSAEAEEAWYAVMTRPRHEKKVAEELARRGVCNYVPLMTAVHRWSDRKKMVSTPLFPGYAFVKIEATPRNKVSVLQVNGVLHFIGNAGHGSAIPESEIESIRGVLASDVPVTPWGFLKVGQRVRVRGGALDGVEGQLVECGRRLVVSVGAIQRGLSIAVEGYQVEPV